MRTFQLTYSVPGTCDCCSAPLPVPAGGASPGTYSIELPEGAARTEVRIADAVTVALGQGKLEVRLRQKKGSSRQWSLKPLFNPGAFVARGSETVHEDGEPEHYFYVFRFDLPEYRPHFSTWWAELTFIETPWGERPLGGSLAQAHNSASLKVRLTRLD